MKTRQGFVSNSSTSSFVVIGFTTEDEKYENMYNNMIHIDDDTMVVGHILQDEEYVVEEHAISDIVRIAAEVAEEYDVPWDTVSLHAGMRSC